MAQLENLSVLGAHPSPRPVSGTYRLYILSTDGHYYLQTSSEEIDLTSSGVTAHNNLTGKQGGTTDEYYHMTNSQNAAATRNANGSQNGLLASSDWSTFNGKMPNPLTTDGDLLARLSGSPARLGVGSEGQVLKVSSGLPAWAAEAGGSVLPTLYITSPLSTGWVSNSTVRIYAGKCRSDDDTTDLILTSTRDAAFGTSGAGGLDTGSEASNTSYHIWLIYNPGTTTYAAMFSLSNSSPTMPSGYTKKRRVGSFYNDPSGNIAKFRVESYGNYRFVIYDEYWQILNNGNSYSSFATVSCSPECPSTSRLVWMNSYVGSGSAATGAGLNEYGADESWPITMKGYISATLMCFIPMDSSQRIKYKVDNYWDYLDLAVMGYTEVV